jgi:CBS domain-containing protein
VFNPNWALWVLTLKLPPCSLGPKNFVKKTALPDLTTIMDSLTQSATVGPKTTVREVVKLMKERRTTAVCVMEHGPQSPGVPSTGPKIAGIFTSKDVVPRVIAAGLDAERCSVVRVMTPHPDTAPPTMSVHDALKKCTVSLFYFVTSLKLTM